MICVNCVTPQALKGLVARVGTHQICQYCSDDEIAVEANVLFERILELVVENTATEDDLSQYEYWMLFEGGSDDIPIACLDVVLSEWLELGEEPYFEDLWSYASKELTTNDRGMERHYFGDDGLLERNFFESKWTNFIQGIKHSHRFFNANAREFLDSVFVMVCDANNALKVECVRIIQKGEPLYRARSASSREQVDKIRLAPASELGPTPKDKAGSQRMTPNGISALYCALERETCLSEIRSITGDNVVSVALTPIKSLKLLDLTKLNLIAPPELTILDKGYLDSMHLKSFISSLVKKISKPKGQNDELSYLSTQVVFEYLRLRFGNQVDGLVFPSVQTGETGTNVVLFPEASSVSDKDHSIPSTAEFPLGQNGYEPGPTLYCIPDSLRYHKVIAIETRAEEYEFSEDLFLSDLHKKRLGRR
ncbi:RES family NAD+ phosphorylase [Pseudomonas syringae]|uniref:RES family NAD+ phosphorylase n=1 Tax=Pseudomonas syringae TaxID=317 RepID=UPI001F0FFEC5|nr:RES family NAD+ phosphorylase [Pseudomonas syringae]MCH5652220.1 RES family NAD+ phosphorylase [Pseudomonas syringae]